MRKFFSVLFLVLCLCGLCSCQKEKEKKETISDATKFKEEYEKLNNTVRESDGAKYNNVSIPVDNPIKYIDCSEALDILNQEKAVIYVGANWCPWCRNAVNVLFDAAKENNIETIYYLNLDDEKDEFTVEDNKVVKTKDGSKAYYQLLEKLDAILSDYTITNDKGKTFDTKEKRIYMPFVMVIKDKKVIDNHVGTVTLNKNQTKYDKMTDDQKTELLNIYNKMFEKIK